MAPNSRGASMKYKKTDDKNERDKKKFIPTTKEKIFTPRNSLLTTMMEISHIKSLYNIFISTLIVLFIHSIVYDYYDTGRFHLGTQLIITGFGKINTVAIIWICMQCTTFLIYYIYKIWAYCTISIFNANFKVIFNAISLTSFVVFLIGFTIIPLWLVWTHDIAVASSFIVILEMIRFSMKMHAFIRTLTPNILKINSITKLNFPSFSWYLYFSFAPTIVYRDSYPRMSERNWKKIIFNLIEFVFTIFLLSFLCERFIVNPWINYGLDSKVLEPKHLILSLFGSMIPAQICCVCCFYLLLHCWHNAWAEMLTFADKQFYLDWWNQTDYGGYYRTWNIVVHDYLYIYIYKDIICLTKSRIIGEIAVFFTSVIYHELTMIFVFKYFYPVMFVFFGVFGVLFKIITKKFNNKNGNIFLWITLITGNGFMWSMYSMEYFARKNCPIVNNNEFLDMLLPRSWFCKNL